MSSSNGKPPLIGVPPPQTLNPNTEKTQTPPQEDLDQSGESAGPDFGHDWRIPADNTKQEWLEQTPASSGVPSPGVSSANPAGGIYDDDDDDDWMSKPVIITEREDIASLPEPGGTKPSSYILAIGKKGSGKSTLQSHLFRYLLTCGDFLVHPDGELAADAPQYRKLLARWQEQWDRGRFPDGTRRGELTDVRHELRSPHGLPPLRFGFLEISGEDFEELTKPDGSPSLLPSIDRFLNNKNVHVCFLFVCNGDDVKGSDYLFRQFLDYLKLKIEKQYRQNSSVALILADPDMCRARLVRDKQYTDSKLNVELFVRTYVPQTAARLTEWERRAMIAPFSVGRIGKRTKKDGTAVKYIAEPSFEDAELIFHWIYEQFTGYSPKGRRTLWDRVEEFLDGFRRLGGA